MEKLKELIKAFTSYPGVTGNEFMALDGLSEYIGSLGVFDETGKTELGSFYGIIRCGKKDAKLLLCDAHIDTVGCVVSEICEGGFLKVSNVGGIAAKILSSAKVNIYGKKTLRGVFASKPPHLQTAGESEKKLEIPDMLIDTGLSKEELEKYVRVGTPVGFSAEMTDLANNIVVGASFDDRLCGAVVVRALMDIDRKNLDCDIAFQFSSGEETDGRGAITTAYRLNPDYAIVLDVTHAFVKGAPKYLECTKAGEGCDLCYSPQTNRAFTKKAALLAEKNSIPVQFSACPRSTGTNSNDIQTLRSGIPTVLISVPLKNMHTMSEIVDLRDAVAAARLVKAIAEDM